MNGIFNSGLKVNVAHHIINENPPAVAVLPKASSDTPKLTVESLNNHVYFYADVDTDRTLALIRSLRGLDEMLRNERMTRDIPDDAFHAPIWLHIQSGGGDAFAGFSAANQIAEISKRTPIYAIAEGVVASAATFIMLACDRRYSLSNTFFLIHAVSTWVYGKYDEFKDEMKLLDKLMHQATQFYADRTSLTEDKLQEMLKHDWWFDAQEALENGFIHEIRNGAK